MASPLASCSGGDFNDITKNDLDRYTDSIDNVLSTEKGRDLFIKSLELNGYQDCLATLELWQYCDTVIGLSAFDPRDENRSNDFHSNLDELIERLDDCELLVLNDIRRIKIAVRSKHRTEIVKALNHVKCVLVNGMSIGYEGFKQWCLKEASKYKTCN